MYTYKELAVLVISVSASTSITTIRRHRHHQNHNHHNNKIICFRTDIQQIEYLWQNHNEIPTSTPRAENTFRKNSVTGIRLHPILVLPSRHFCKPPTKTARKKQRKTT